MLLSLSLCAEPPFQASSTLFHAHNSGAAVRDDPAGGMPSGKPRPTFRSGDSPQLFNAVTYYMSQALAVSCK